jgi:hypothetical protein
LAKALYDYSGGEGKLAFKKGEEVMVRESSEKGWCTGELHGQKGCFPESYVQRIDKAGDSNGTHLSVIAEGVTKYDFQGQKETELSFVTGEKVKVFEKLPKGIADNIM